MSAPSSRKLPGATTGASNWLKIKQTVQLEDKQRRRREQRKQRKTELKARQKSEQTKTTTKPGLDEAVNSGESISGRVKTGKKNPKALGDERKRTQLDTTRSWTIDKTPSCKKPKVVQEKWDGEGLQASTLTQKPKPYAVDCEYVGSGWAGSEDVLARVSVVDLAGSVILDRYVAPEAKVTDFRTRVSGIRPRDLIGAHPFRDVQCEVERILDGNILVGQAVANDLRVLKLQHPREMTRDLIGFPPFQSMCDSPRPSLKLMAQKILGVSIQHGEHDSATDARVTMQLYALHRKQFEKWHKGLERAKSRITK